MATKVRLSPLAEIDLLDIALYIGAENPRASDDFAHEIDDAFALLLTQPEMGRKRPELGPELRSFPVRNYLILNDPVPEGSLLLESFTVPGILRI